MLEYKPIHGRVGIEKFSHGIRAKFWVSCFHLTLAFFFPSSSVSYLLSRTLDILHIVMDNGSALSQLIPSTANLTPPPPSSLDCGEVVSPMALHQS